MVLLDPAAGELVPAVTVVVHPIDTESHPSTPPGWRWAIMVGGAAPGDLSRCANAGWAADETTAWADGEQVGAAVCRAVRMFGIPAQYACLPLAYDPIPAGEDRLNPPP